MSQQSHKPLIAIVGPSGSGKSTSLRNLNPETTIILDLERKGLPFKNASKLNVIPCANYGSFTSELDKALKDENMNAIVIESATKFFEMLLGVAQASYKGYDVWSFYNKSIGSLFEKVKNTHAAIIITAIDEVVKIQLPEGGEQARRAIAVKGKEWEGKVEKEMLMVLFTEPKRGKDGKMTYNFQTNTDGVTSAKTPMEMFDGLIENDIQLVLNRFDEYNK